MMRLLLTVPFPAIAAMAAVMTATISGLSSPLAEADAGATEETAAAGAGSADTFFFPNILFTRDDSQESSPFLSLSC